MEKADRLLEMYGATAARIALHDPLQHETGVFSGVYREDLVAALARLEARDPNKAWNNQYQLHMAQQAQERPLLLENVYIYDPMNPSCPQVCCWCGCFVFCGFFLCYRLHNCKYEPPCGECVKKPYPKNIVYKKDYDDEKTKNLFH